ncbi:MAG: LptF/LptG family permease, partial [Armatimonadota bacterium]
MKLVDKQVLRELVGPFLFGVMAFSSVFFAGTYLLKLTNWVMNGMPLVTAVWIVLLLLPSIVVYTLPMSTLLAVLLGVGRLSGDSEIVALYASGVSFYRVAVPIVALGVMVTGSSIALNELVSPQAYARSQELQAAILKQ